MPEKISYAQSGEPIVSIDNAFLHSRYDPRAEAVRYVDSLSTIGKAEIFLLIEPGLGYLVCALREKRPDARILVARCSLFFSGGEARLIDCQPDGEWIPNGGIGFNKFLENNISDFEAHSVKIIEWKPSIGAYRNSALKLVSEAAVFLKRAAANARTIAEFGGKWFRNAVSFASNASATLRAVPGNAPIAVVAAGPSLEKSIPALRAAQKSGGLFIVSVASALPALASGNVRADITVATDGGGWAAFHLHEAFRSGIPPAIAFTAAFPSSLFSTAVLPIRDSSRWQAIIASAADLSAFVAPQRGTVAATAIDLALSLTSGPLFLTGFDLGVRQGKTHARPNALDCFHEDVAERLRPAASAAYSRFVSARDGGSLRIYADWMSEHLLEYFSRICILGSASMALNRFKHTERIQCTDGRKPIFETMQCGGDSSARRSALIVAIRNAVSADAAVFEKGNSARLDLLNGRSVVGELLELFFPEELAAAEKRRTNGVPLQFALDSVKKIERVLDDIR